jgi:hypothetical protein
MNVPESVLYAANYLRDNEGEWLDEPGSDADMGSINLFSMMRSDSAFILYAKELSKWFLEMVEKGKINVCDQ